MNTPQATDHLLNGATVETYRRAMTDAINLVSSSISDASQPVRHHGVPQHQHAVNAINLDSPTASLSHALNELREIYTQHAVYFHHPDYVAHLNCPVLLPAVAAEAVISAVNSSLDTWDQSIAGTAIEERLIRWTADQIGFGPDADGVFTSGGSASNLQALLLARGDAIERRTGRQGLENIPSDFLSHMVVFCTEESHFSVRKSVGILGMNRHNVVQVATDSSGRMNPEDLRAQLDQAVAADRIPMAVVATAGTTDRGAIDPVAALSEAVAPHQCWLHVDAAVGGGLLCSRQRRDLIAGVERADSVTVDYHKTYFQPVSASAIIVADAAKLRHVQWHAEYLNPQDGHYPNQVTKSLATTRRFDALKLWLTLRTVGADTIGDLFNRCLETSALSYMEICADPFFEALEAPSLNMVMFRYRPPGMTVTEADRVNPMIRDELFNKGRAIVAGTKHHGHYWLKLTILNPETSSDNVRLILSVLRDIGHDLAMTDGEALRQVSAAPSEHPSVQAVPVR